MQEAITYVYEANIRTTDVYGLVMVEQQRGELVNNAEPIIKTVSDPYHLTIQEAESLREALTQALFIADRWQGQGDKWLED